MAKEYLDINGLSYYTNNLTTYVDNEVAKNKQVLVYENKSSFPPTGKQDCIYFDKSEPQIYAWNGTDYVKLGGSQVPSTGLEIGTTTGTAYEGSKGVALETKVTNIESINTTQTNNISSLQTTVNKHDTKLDKIGKYLTNIDLDENLGDEGDGQVIYTSIYDADTGESTISLFTIPMADASENRAGLIFPAEKAWMDIARGNGEHNGWGFYVPGEIDGDPYGYLDIKYESDRLGLEIYAIDATNNNTTLVPYISAATTTSAGVMSATDKTELEKLRGLYSKMSGLTYTFTSGSQTATIDGVSTTLQSGTEYPVLWSLKNKLTGDVTIEMVRPSFNFMNDMSGMFSSCGDLTSLNLDKFNTDHVYKMDTMFSSCKALTSLSLDGFKTDEVTSFLRMFQNCSSLTSLNLFTFDTSKATTMMGMFHGCSNLTEITGDSLTTENVSNFGNMFYGCSKLTSLSWMFDTSKATTMANMFSGCSSLTTLDMSGFDFSKVAGVANMFKGCTSLSLITKAPSNIGVDLDMSECPLTAGSAVFIIAGLKNVSETKTLKLKASTYSALTAAQIKVATDKGWTVTSV